MHLITDLHRFFTRFALLCLLALAGCGGGSDSGGDATSAPTTPEGSCSLREQQDWLRAHFRDRYFWADLSPDPSPDGVESLETYFEMLRFKGNAEFPSDRYSGFGTTASFNQYYGEGKTLGYGVAVAGFEVQGFPDRPLAVRYVEPGSPAARAGIARGDRVISLNGRPARDLIAQNDFAALVPSAAGDQLQLEAERGGQVYSRTLVGEVYSVTPVQNATVVQSALGRKVGYIQVQSFLSQAESEFDMAFRQFDREGVDDLVIDLRYNPGGLVSTGAKLASYVGGIRKVGLPYARLVYNAKNMGLNQTYLFTFPYNWRGVDRAYVLTGQRTCSASEQLVNGFRGAGIQTVVIGDTSCGKPIGFVPTNHCGNTYSVVAFESLNARGEGRYFNGFEPLCRVADDLSRPQGDPRESLFAAALYHADTGQCPVGSQSSQALSFASLMRPVQRPGMDQLPLEERPVMFPR